MILINGGWEIVENIDDIERIIRDELSEELGIELSKQAKDIELDSGELDDLKNENDEMSDELSYYYDMETRYEAIIEKMKELEDYIDKNADGTDFMEGMKKALDIMGK